MSSPTRSEVRESPGVLPADDTGPAAGHTVVLLHARPTDRSMWRAHLPEFAAAGMRAIGYRPHDQPPSAVLQAAWDEERTALARGDIDEAVRAGVTAWTAPATPEATKASVTRMLCDQLERRGQHGAPAAGADPLQRPGALDMPDFFEGGEALARELGAGPLVVVPGAAHLVPLDQPAAFRRLVLNFLDTVDGPQ
ncbi:alpha/beta hydrolase [Mycobacterium sp. ITM-2016-00317]|uniref:alpha/beta fold hydrolase n=1 Tax=Mycobacterium sp. ITM-2016-00317 TaxID=2099694 RepID=UPI00287F7339|nr:alpha/beta hydrolase [Mycobacterium sp. ITM-2016-00317]WNG85904.1 alpha/beta hydrolase [Mycobacterium sp. ITM-2016-00317]